MIVDTSALVAILLDEPERAAFIRLIASTGNSWISSGTAIELTAVCTRRQIASDQSLTALFDRLNLRIAPVTAEQALIGQAAYRTFGIGSGHPARLNFGDCFAYALAKATGEPLLFKGDDFIHTDITPAL